MSAAEETTLLMVDMSSLLLLITWTSINTSTMHLHKVAE